MDFEWLSQWNWSAAKNGHTFYATRAAGRAAAKISMHRAILNPPEGMEVDHINGDGLDNRRANLRLVTRTENLRHRKTFRNSKSGYKGVVFNSQNGRWRASLNIGTFDTAEEAARASDNIVRKSFGPFARTNFDDGDES